MDLYLMATKDKFINMKALDVQVGGNHYKNMNMQPVELFAKTHCTAFQANIWKYITRYKYKNGAEDIEKCIHYAKLAEELKCYAVFDYPKMSTVYKFCERNNLSEEVKDIVVAAAHNRYGCVIRKCEELLCKEYPEK